MYISTVATNPKTLLGFGTWEQIKDRFLLTAGSTYSAGSTGGEASHKLTTSEMPSHSHAFHGSAGNELQKSAGTGYWGVEYTPNGTSGAYINNAGSGTAHNNMPPYLTVYVWKRTA